MAAKSARSSGAGPKAGARSESARGRSPDGASGARLVDAKLEAIGGWRGELLTELRGLIRDADPDVTETIKWRKPSNPSGVPVWEHAGIICTGEVYRDKVKVTFASGAALPDPAGLFNASLDGAARRAIDLHEGDRIDRRAFKALVRAAVALNRQRRGG